MITCVWFLLLHCDIKYVCIVKLFINNNNNNDNDDNNSPLYFVINLALMSDCV